MRKCIWLVLLLAIFSACSNRGDQVLSIQEEKLQDEKVTIRIFDRKIEVADRLQELAALYESLYPGVKIEFESLGAISSSYDVELNSKFGLGTFPDIFTTEAYLSFEPWEDIALPLNDFSWIDDTVEGSTDGVTVNGTIYGVPIALEAYGYIYNKDLFAKAGITTIPTTISELREAARKLKATGVTPFSNGYAEWWILGNHSFNIALASHETPNEYIEGILDGTINLSNDETMNAWVDWLDLTIQYGNKDPLSTDYQTQVEKLVKGEAAMMQQGNWTQLMINELNSDINLGIMPIPISDKGHDYIMVGVPNYWIVHNQSPVKEEAIEFIEWLVTSEEGKAFIVNDLEYIPSFTNIEYDAQKLGDITASLQTYIDQEKTTGWYWSNFPSESANLIFENIQKYLRGQATREQFLTNLQKDIQSIQ
ncbi:hypothetical protein BKP37_15465 [Anaerobacillus alkalilacustris]|uniref:ABC transporter substrate-binding protein n=1 Tax=Anaerobacillus alkalilacustris TaxID=393763 RepID=A0A1S2LIB8_9BACI|nr:ABC transporter substrate-binding protein [Anaerobacillus alkalilacustris]OIJ11833.1 hypothetical protein BKP37_15465 [Anaerobacillus alkalilacustris]